jgi:hypothetical protein
MQSDTEFCDKMCQFGKLTEIVEWRLNGGYNCKKKLAAKVKCLCFLISEKGKNKILPQVAVSRNDN